MKIIIVTACHSGIATNLIAAGILESAVKKRGWQAIVECQSTLLKNDCLTAEEIAKADLILIATNISIPLERFVGKQIFQTSLDEAINRYETILDNLLKESTLLSKEMADSHRVANDKSQASNNEGKMHPSEKIVAITACPTGVAHTFMAAEALEKTAKELGYEIKVETRGSVGAQNTLSDQEILDADLVIIAADIDIPLERFSGKKIYKTTTGLALKKTAQEIQKAKTLATIYEPNTTHFATSPSQQQETTGPYKHLMTGVSFMLPMVVAGGLIIALSFIFGIEAFKEEGTLAAALMQIGGSSAFALMIPILAGYIAFSIADRPGLAPGLVGGMLASSLGAGFIGGIIAGFIAGYVAKGIASYLHLPKSMAALKPILIIPFVATLITGLLMIYVVGTPISKIMATMTHFLQNMGTDQAIMLGVILGAMMCFDLGGPVNKAAYAFGTGLITTQTYEPMAAIMAAGMVPALGMGVSTFIAKNKFLPNEREAGKASFVLGLCFISEGAIPFAAKDPLKVIPSCMIGGALAGGMSMFFGAQLMAPHGGLFVLFIPNAISHLVPYLLSIVAGTITTGVIYSILKNKQTLV